MAISIFCSWTSLSFLSIFCVAANKILTVLYLQQELWFHLFNSTLLIVPPAITFYIKINKDKAGGLPLTAYLHTC